MSRIFELKIPSLADCERFAASLAACVKVPLAIGLSGTLGAGKTQWTRFFVKSLGGQEIEVSSPTFVLVKEYATVPKIYHLDVYRVADEDELLELGIEEFFDAPAVTIVEWADRFLERMPTNWIHLQWSLDEWDPNQRVVTVDAIGKRATSVANEWGRSLGVSFISTTL
ncbi:tRNA (adenosine(37)-N6)-threonylcarbamoyltransferase complex ATPase subunit type 1 TsaE [Pirellulaceae bacterium SH467]|jgi:tRNA threonylcarbamoyladenosine biosynthesis protein TsaE